METSRVSKDEYYLRIAENIFDRSTCLRRHFGAVIVNNDEIVATGYNGAPRKVKSSMEHGFCWRKEHNVPHGKNYELCRSVHAEQNAMIQASRRDMLGSTLYLVGENLDKTRAHYQAETGKIVQLMRGIYVDSADDIDAVVLRHAVRIARYLYPRAYLSGASAVLLAPTRDGRLFVSGPRSQRTRIRALEIIQNVAPEQPSTASAVIQDGLGEFRVDVSSVRQRFLEAFRLRSEHGATLDDSMRAHIAQRLIEEY
ncbi:hypothetical protein IIB79_00665, partial [candidate division KSB1 bacterium]|nr:hypothetical protein [candidate division KSB1 bacterium]